MKNIDRYDEIVTEYLKSDVQQCKDPLFAITPAMDRQHP